MAVITFDFIDTTSADTSVREKTGTNFLSRLRDKLVYALQTIKNKIVNTYRSFMNWIFQTRPMQNYRFRTFTVVFFQAMLWAMAIFTFYFAFIYAYVTLFILLYMLTGMEILSWILAFGILYGICAAIWSMFI